MIHDTQSAQISQKQDERNIYAIMKTMCPPGYHHTGFVAAHALGHNDVRFHNVYNLQVDLKMNQAVNQIIFVVVQEQKHHFKKAFFWYSKMHTLVCAKKQCFSNRNIFIYITDI